VSQVNLLPREILDRHRERRLAVLVAIAGAIVLVLIFAFYLYQTTRLSSVNDEIATAEGDNQSVQKQIDDLQNYAALQEKAQEQESLLSSAYQNDVNFSQLLMDVSRVIPSDEYLDTLTFQVSAAPASATGTTTTTTTETPSFVGAMSATGKGVSVDTLAMWLTRMESVKGWVNAWMGSVTRDATGTSYTFSSGVDLTDGVLSERGKAANRAQG
jgi:Tfp pilus assembly protein PilN